MPAAASALPGRSVSAKPDRMIKRVTYAGVQHLHYEYGPIQVLPGQNNIEAHITQLKPKVPWLHHALQAEPRVLGVAQGASASTSVHLHHGVWRMKGLPDVRCRRGEDDVWSPSRLSATT
jgi:hypothetical protein